MIRSFLFISLALMLALTSQSMAVARGASAATGKIVLCTGTGPVAVYIDAEGQPTTAPHVCPDCALNAVFGGVAPDLRAPAKITAFVPGTLTAAAVLPARPAFGPPSTGPPVSV